MPRVARRLLVAGGSEALATIRQRPLRALLAATAMAAAVATTAIVQTALDGLARAAREASARAFGSDSFVIAKVATGNVSRRELAQRLERNPDITRADVRFLEAVADDRVMYAATPSGRPTSSPAGGGSRARRSTARRRRCSRFAMSAWTSAVPSRAPRRSAPCRSIVAGRGIVDALFPAGDPLGAAVRIGNRAFRIVGIQARQGTAGGMSLDRYVWMPLAAFERTFGPVRSLQVFAKAPDASRTQAAEDHARASMRARRHLRLAFPTRSI